MADDQVEVVIIDMGDLAMEVEGDEFFEQPTVYSFGGGKREFKDKGLDSSLYDPIPGYPE